ncbi:MAG: hypothetical protein AAF383_16885, partial [Cyanobacteria bacterium P01_A01_bin.83]
LPTNISQAIALSSLAGEELIEGWRSVTEAIAPDKITHRSIKSFLFPPSINDLPDTKISVPPSLHEDIHREAADRGLAIAQLLKLMFDFFVSGGNSHLSSHDINEENYTEKERIWRDDLQVLANN